MLTNSDSMILISNVCARDTLQVGVSLACVTRELGEALRVGLENSASHAEVHTDRVAMTRPANQFVKMAPVIDGRESLRSAVTVGFAKLRRLA